MLVSLAIYDGQLEKLQKAICTQHEPIHACFLGISGIGKSTLLNALIAKDKSVLPAGGIGPLTAQAITVKYGYKPSFKVEYHDRGGISRLRFALEQFYKAEKKEEQKTIEVASEELPGLEEEFKQEINEMISGDGDSRKREKKEILIKQARLMITNKPNGDQDLPYLIDGIRAIHEEQPTTEGNLVEEDLKRVNRLRESIKMVALNTPTTRIVLLERI